MIKYLFFILFFLFNAFLSFKWGGSITIESQTSSVEILQNISSVIFGVMGAWIAIVYPEALSGILKWQNTDNDKQVLAVQKILMPIKIATFVLIYTLLFFWLSPIVSRIEFFLNNKEFFRSLNYFCIGSSFILLLISIIYSFFPMEKVQNLIKRKNETRKSLERKRGRASFDK